MTRRKPYSHVIKENQIRAEHVKGKGDTLYKGFQCLNPQCTNFIFVEEDSISEDFEIICPDCGFTLRSGDSTKFYDYIMEVEEDGAKINKSDGEFLILHDDYLDEAAEYKYCIVCNTMKSVDYFDHHNSRNSKRQGECKLCKKLYNDIKNGTRLSDQHREAAQKRRLYLDLSGNAKINSKAIYTRFEYKCFNCGEDLSNVSSSHERPLDHTLPVYYLWPITTETATLLCRICNGNKSGAWPSSFYDDKKRHELSVITGLPYELLSGNPVYNPDAIENLKKPATVDALLAKYSAYMDELITLRNRLIRDIRFDFFSVSTKISQVWIDKANELLK